MRTQSPAKSVDASNNSCHTCIAVYLAVHCTRVTHRSSLKPLSYETLKHEAEEEEEESP